MMEMKLFRDYKKTAYYASADGKIFSLHKGTKRWFQMKLYKLPNGYSQFCCWQNGVQKHVSVHRAVWEAFHGKIPEGLEINHLNCIRTDNRLENLELVTPSENQNHPLSREHAREAKRHKMKPVQDVTTGKIYESTMEAARQTGLDQGSISACCLGKRNHTGGHVFRFAS